MFRAEKLPTEKHKSTSAPQIRVKVAQHVHGGGTNYSTTMVTAAFSLAARLSIGVYLSTWYQGVHQEIVFWSANIRGSLDVQYRIGRGEMPGLCIDHHEAMSARDGGEMHNQG